MSLTCGIVGLPNVGKSTLFNCLSAAQAESANYPFCTIEPNVGVVPVPDKRLAQISSLVLPEKIVNAVVSFVDIAGLVKGASSGEGLGNKFLSHIKEASAICHMVRCFDDENIVHVEGGVDPLRDVSIIETELILKDLETVEKQLDKQRKLAKLGDAKVKKLLSFYEDLSLHLQSNKLARKYKPAEDEDIIKAFKELYLLTQKPCLFVANVSEEHVSSGNEHVKKLQEFAKQREDDVVIICAKIESELKDLEEEEKLMFLNELGLTSAGLDRLIKKAYDLLGLATYFTAGKKEVRAWTFKKGDKAPKAAGVIHTDFEKGFIRAEVCSIDDFLTNKGEAGAKAAGKMRVEGKEYVVQDGDIMHFRFNV